MYIHSSGRTRQRISIVISYRSAIHVVDLASLAREYTFWQQAANDRTKCILTPVVSDDRAELKGSVGLIHTLIYPRTVTMLA